MNIIVNKENIFVATGGQVFDPKKATVVLVHGSGLDHRCWALQARWFAFHDYSVFAPDLPGHSLSEGEPIKSIEGMGEWLAAALQTAGCNSIHLVGHSMGFQIALEACAGLGEKLKTLTAVASAAAIPVNDVLIKTAKKSAQEAADMMLAWGFGSESQKGLSAVPGAQPIAIGRQIMSTNPLAVDLVACNKYSAGIERAKELQIPAHVVLATEDKMTPYKTGIDLAEALRAKVTSISKTGHMLPMEAPKASLDAVKSFIQKN